LNGGTASSNKQDAGTAPAPPTCTRTAECLGGEFCDQGACVQISTGMFGHGYGAQCLPAEEYPLLVPGMDGLWTHCTDYPCVAGHCSSCSSDSDCAERGQCVAYPGKPGRLCTDPENVPSAPEECGVSPSFVPCPEPDAYPEPTLVGSRGSGCAQNKDCAGDEFCDRGVCAPVLADRYGHGYGVACRRIEQQSPGDTCLGYLCLGGACQSCLADSECYEGAPYCNERNPFRPAGRVCAPHRQSYYLDRDGNVTENVAEDYEVFRTQWEHMMEVRENIGLPTLQLPALP
jgi:hypothetical protein